MVEAALRKKFFSKENVLKRKVHALNENLETKFAEVRSLHQERNKLGE